MSASPSPRSRREAAAGGPIGLVENGDIIAIDVEKRTADLEVSEAELEARRRRT